MNSTPCIPQDNQREREQSVSSIARHSSYFKSGTRHATLTFMMFALSWDDVQANAPYCALGLYAGIPFFFPQPLTVLFKSGAINNQAIAATIAPIPSITQLFF